MPGIGPASDDREHELLAAGADPDWRMRLLHRARVVAGVLELVVPALEARLVCRHQQSHDLDGFVQTLGALLDRGKGDAQFLVLRLVPGRPHTDLEPAIGDVIDGDRLGREYG